MLVLARKKNEKIHIGDNVTITVVGIKGSIVRLGFEAPKEVEILRGELKQRAQKAQETQQATLPFMRQEVAAVVVPAVAESFWDDEEPYPAA